MAVERFRRRKNQEVYTILSSLYRLAVIKIPSNAKYQRKTMLKSGSKQMRFRNNIYFRGKKNIELRPLLPLATTGYLHHFF